MFVVEKGRQALRLIMKAGMANPIMHPLLLLSK